MITQKWRLIKFTQSEAWHNEEWNKKVDLFRCGCEHSFGLFNLHQDSGALIIWFGLQILLKEPEAKINFLKWYPVQKWSG